MPTVRLTIVNNSSKVRLTTGVTTRSVRVNVTQNVRNVRLTIGLALGTGVSVKAPPLRVMADGPNVYDPPSGQRRIYLPSGTKPYLIFKGGFFLDIDYHYTKTGNYIDLLDTIGDINEEDTFTICEY